MACLATGYRLLPGRLRRPGISWNRETFLFRRVALRPTMEPWAPRPVFAVSPGLKRPLAILPEAPGGPERQ